MDNLSKAVRLIATDPEFRAAWLADPEGALTQRNLDVSTEEWTILSKAAHLLALPSGRLLSHMLSAPEGPDQQWPWIAPPARDATGAR